MNGAPDGAGARAFVAEAMRIDGRRASGPRRIDVRDPYRGDVVGSVPCADADDVRDAVQGAARFQAALSRHERAGILERAAGLLRARAGQAAGLITLESGLCLKDSRHEIERVVDVLRFAAAEALRDDAEVFAGDVTARGRKCRVITQREPLQGVIAAITPFNHPMNQVAHKIAPAIATNNRTVLKPSDKTPLSALFLADLLYEAGLPPPMLQVLTGEAAPIVDALLADPQVALLSFTGGVDVGKRIAERLGYRRGVFELGGNDALLVMDDADVRHAAELARSGCFGNSGQRCTAVKRVLVHRRVREEFTERLLALTAAWRFGDPFEPENDMGTVIDEPAARAIEARVRGAVDAGARLLAGGQRRGALLAPTVLDRVEASMELVARETFGPVAPILEFDDLDQAIALVNATAYGLSCGVCTNRLDDITRLASELRVGTVNVGEVPGWRLELTPFGGVKDSGLGVKEGVREAMRGFTHVKVLSLPWA